MVNQTWNNIVEGLGLQGATLAHRLLSGAAAPDWSESPGEFGALVSPSTANSTKAMLLRLSAAEERAYALIVLGGKVAALHGFVEPPELNAQGGKFIAFLGDIRKVAGQTINPDLYELPGTNSRTATATHFATEKVPAEEWDEIATELEADAAKALAFRRPNLDGGGEAPMVDIHQLLPVPEVIAGLFLKAIPARAAFQRGGALRSIIPENQRDNYKPLVAHRKKKERRMSDSRSAQASGVVSIVLGARTNDS